MGKNGKKQRHQQNPTSRLRHSHYNEEDDYDSFNHSLPLCPSHLSIEKEEEEEDNDDYNNNNNNEDNNEDGKSNFDFIIPSKFSLYQQSVQSPKGDISYLQKFFLMYVGGRVPLHLQEDFCGTALLSTEWLRTDPRRTAIGVDLDLEALTWSLENNLNKHNDENTPRIALFHGNVLGPNESTLVKPNPELLIRKLTLKDDEEAASLQPVTKGDFALPARDIVCAFNYSCCCLHNRKELVGYFEHARDALSKKGGIFVMDLYGGTSSERELKLQRKFPNFTYTWEQAEFDVIQRKTRISLHYQLYKPQKKIRNAFSYSWRVWSLPEIRECLEEAGFKSVHFWIRAMPDTDQNRNSVGFGASRDDKYEEVTCFVQQDAWNAYVVAVA